MNTKPLLLAALLCWLITTGGDIARGQDTAPPHVPAPATPDPAAVAQADMDRLQGEWQCVAWTYNGRDDHDRGKSFHTSYAGNRLTLWENDKQYRHGLVTLDPQRSPKAMNTWDLDGSGADRTNRGIYEIDGDTLRICIALDASTDRPKEFTCEPNSRRLLVVYQRRKP